jgi:hypothetical protein
MASIPYAIRSDPDPVQRLFHEMSDGCFSKRVRFNYVDKKKVKGKK